LRVQAQHYDLEVKLVKIGTQDDLIFEIVRGSLKRGNRIYSVKKGFCVYDQTSGLTCAGEAAVSHEVFGSRSSRLERSLLVRDQRLRR